MRYKHLTKNKKNANIFVSIIIYNNKSGKQGQNRSNSVTQSYRVLLIFTDSQLPHNNNIHKGKAGVIL